MLVEEAEQLGVVVEVRRDGDVERADALLAAVDPGADGEAVGGVRARAPAVGGAVGVGGVAPARVAVDGGARRGDLGGVGVGAEGVDGALGRGRGEAAVVAVDDLLGAFVDAEVAGVLGDGADDGGAVAVDGADAGDEGREEGLDEGVEVAPHAAEAGEEALEAAWRGRDGGRPRDEADDGGGGLREGAAVEGGGVAGPRFGEPREVDAAGEGDVGVGVEEGELRGRGQDGGVAVDEEHLGGGAVVGDAERAHLPARPGLAHDPVDDLGAVADLVRGPGVRAHAGGGAGAAHVHVDPRVAGGEEDAARARVEVERFGDERARAREARREGAQVAGLPEDRRGAGRERVGEEDLDGDADAVAHREVARAAAGADAGPGGGDGGGVPGAVGHGSGGGWYEDPGRAGAAFSGMLGGRGLPARRRRGDVFARVTSRPEELEEMLADLQRRRGL